MKDEERLLLAFVLSLLIIFLFSRLYQPSPPARVATEKRTEEKVSPAGSLAGARKSTELINLETGMVRMAVGTTGGKIEEISLKHYLRPGEQFFTIASDFGAFLDYSEVQADTWIATRYQVRAEEREIHLSGFPLPGLEVGKSFHLSPSGYTIKAEVALVNHGKEEIKLKNYRVLGGILNPADRREKTATAEFKAAGPAGIIRKNLAGRVGNYSGEEAFWLSLWSHYSLFFLHPEEKAGWFLSDFGSSVAFGLLYPEVVIPAQGRKVFRFSFYAGPSDYFILSREVKEPVLGNGFFAGMGRFLFTILQAIHRVVGNWGWAIVILTLLVKLVFYPLTRSSLQSMKQMQHLRPYLKDLQTKYKDNPQQMQKEIMNLYREYKINPFSGCLPMLIQFPIFIGLFVALRNSIFLRGAPFALWIRDLSQPDQLFSLGGFSVNLLPIIMAGTSFWQQKLTPQEPTQKSLTFLMPVMFLFLFYNFSSGLLLYWVTMNLAGLAEQYLISRDTGKSRK